MNTVFVVDDNKNIARMLGKAIRKVGDVDVRVFNRPVLALVAAREDPPTLIITDMMMPVMSGLDLIRALRKEGINSEVIFITAYAEATFANVLPSNRIRKVMQKPVSLREVQAEVACALNGGSHVTQQ